MEPVIRRARTADVAAIRGLVDAYAGRILLEKATVQLYEDIQEFFVAEVDGVVRGCGALHVMWQDLGEVRTVVVDPAAQGQGLGHLLLERLVDQARWLGIRRVFVLTFEVPFFTRHGFQEIGGSPVSQEVYAEMMQSADEGVAEFLDLAYVKPNTLGNTRMLLEL
jgi:amino-acid N-acetyltransferase